MKVEILAKPDQVAKMEAMATAIRQAAKNANVQVQISFSNDFTAFSQHSFNPAATPVIFIHGKMEFQGEVPPLQLIQKKFVELKEKGVDSSNWI